MYVYIIPVAKLMYGGTYMTLIINEMLRKKGKATQHNKKTKQHNTTRSRQLKKKAALGGTQTHDHLLSSVDIITHMYAHNYHIVQYVWHAGVSRWRPGQLDDPWAPSEGHGRSHGSGGLP